MHGRSCTGAFEKMGVRSHCTSFLVALPPLDQSYLVLCFALAYFSFLPLCSTSSLMLQNDPSVHCEYVLLPLVNKEVEWPVARQDKVRWGNQTGYWDEEGQSQREQDGHFVPSHLAKHR